MAEELEDIKRSLQKDAGLPKVPDLEASVRTLATVKSEIDAATVKADELASTAVYLQGLVGQLTSALARLERAEGELVDLTVAYLQNRKKA
jgi:hypothetical protein